MPPAMMRGWVGAVIVAVVAIVYLWPSFVALARKQPRPGAIFLLNLLLGWTIVGWIVAYRLATKSEFEDDLPSRRRRRSRRR